MSDVSDVFFMLCPWPHKKGRRLRPGSKLEIPRVCRRCVTKACIDRHLDNPPENGVDPWRCEYEVSTYSFSIEGEQFLVVGVANPDHSLITNRDRRRTFKKRRVRPEEVERLRQDVGRLVGSHRKAVNSEVRAIVAPLHDIKTMVGVMKNNIDGLVARLRNGCLIADATNQRAITRIEKTGTLLISRLHSSDIMINPQVASQGEATRRSLWGMCYSLVKCFEDEAESRQKRVWAAGGSEKEVLVKDSFESIPFLLIENGIKYANPGTQITVYVHDHSRSVSIEVVSEGRIIPEEERTKIFRRGYRGSNANDERGSGLGLWCAQVVANAHGTRVNYEVRHIQNKPHNVFTVVLPAIGTSTRIQRRRTSGSVQPHRT